MWLFLLKIRQVQHLTLTYLELSHCQEVWIITVSIWFIPTPHLSSTKTSQKQFGGRYFHLKLKSGCGRSRMFTMKAIWFLLVLASMCLLIFSHFLFRNGPPASSFHTAAIWMESFVNRCDYIAFSLCSFQMFWVCLHFDWRMVRGGWQRGNEGSRTVRMLSNWHFQIVKNGLLISSYYYLLIKHLSLTEGWVRNGYLKVVIEKYLLLCAPASLWPLLDTYPAVITRTNYGMLCARVQEAEA